MATCDHVTQGGGRCANPIGPTTLKCAAGHHVGRVTLEPQTAPTLPDGYRIAHNGRSGSARRWFVLGPSPAQLGEDADDHEKPQISFTYTSRAALRAAIERGDAWRPGRGPGLALDDVSFEEVMASASAYSTNEQLVIDAAVAIAHEAHRGQTDRQGKPYVGHVLAVASRLADQGMPAEVVAAGALHDVLEDTELTAADLRGMDVGERTVKIVEALTHPDGEPYQDYIDRICGMTDDVVRVKLADMEHNFGRIATVVDGPTRLRLERKYGAALPKLWRRLGLAPS